MLGDDAWRALSYALRRGSGQIFQLEENELAVAIVGEDAQRALMIYENAEGSLGVLSRLAESASALARCAQAALAICHFSPEGEDLFPACAGACYRCLLSFDNQAEALRLNRHAIRDVLLALRNARSLRRYDGRAWDEQLAWLRRRIDPQSELEARFLNALAARGLRLPDAAQWSVDDPPCLADFFYRPRALVFCDGSAHDRPEQRSKDESLRSALCEQGFQVVVIRYDRDLNEQIDEQSALFGI